MSLPNREFERLNTIPNKVLRLLLLSDGSTTLNLQIIYGSSDVRIELLHQELSLDVTGMNGLFDLERKTRLFCNQNACSYNMVAFNTKIVDKSFVDELWEGRIPLGILLEKYELQVRREIVDYGTAGRGEVAGIFQDIPERECYYYKHYLMKYMGQPLCSVREYFLIDEADLSP